MHPCDDVSTKILTKQLLDLNKPSYTRTARNKTPVLYDGKEDLIEIGKGVRLSKGTDVAIIACGVMVSESIKGSRRFEDQRNRSFCSRHAYNKTVGYQFNR